MDPINDIYLNQKIIQQLENTLSGKAFSHPEWEKNYFGYSENNDTYVIATYVYMEEKDGAGFWAFTAQEDEVTLKNIYFATGEDVYWDIISFAKLKYPDLKDIVLD